MTAESNEATKRMIAFLRKPSSYSNHPAEVQIKQTHASILAIAPPYVYKVKKQVNLGFLDFTSLPQRKANCERELRLNSRLCAGLYVGIVPIVLRNGELHFGSDGQVVDYALQMKQLADGFFMNQLLQQGQLKIDKIEPVLERLKNFYTTQPADASIATYGNMAHMKVNTDENMASLQADVKDNTHKVVLKAISSFVDTFYEKFRLLFDKRVKEHRIKDCHGDLHLDHIHLQDGKVCIYDCIEFNDRFRYIDVASDIAFLAMDLDFYGRPDLSAYVANRMAELLHDPDLKLLMDFYKCYRACVRAKVETIKCGEKEISAQERKISLEYATHYISLALQYAIFGSRPTVLIVCGKVGSGKSTLAKRLTELLHWKYIGSDEIRKQQAGLPLYKRTDAHKRKWVYARERSEQVYNTLLTTSLAHVHNYRSMVVDATFGQAAHRALFIEALEELQVPYYFLEMQASDEIIKQRLAQREKDKQVVSDARLEDFEWLSHSYQELNEIPAAHLLKIHSHVDMEETLANVFNQFSGSESIKLK